MMNSEYDELYDNLSQFEPNVNVSKAKKAARNHDPLALVAHSHVHSSLSHASPSYSHSPQTYHVTHPSSVIDYEEDYQGEDGRVDMQSKNVGYAGNGNRNAERQNRNQAANAGIGEQMLLAMKDKAGSNLNEEENDFTLDNAYGDDTFEELTVGVIMMAHIQPADDKADVKPKYDVEAISEVNALQINLKSGMLSKGVHELTNHEKLKTVINISADDQIDSNIIFDDSCVEMEHMTMIQIFMINRVTSSSSVRRPESKDTNLKKRVLLNTKSKSTVKRALFTSHVAAKSRNLGATSVVAKSSGCSKHMTGNLKLLGNSVEKFMGTVRFGPYFNCSNFQDSLENSNAIPSKEDLDNLFGPLYEEYYVTRSLKVLDNSTTNTLDQEDTHSSSLIIVEENEAPQIVTSLEKPVTNEPKTPNSNDNADESVQKDVAKLDGNTFINLFATPEF
nr:hypothetical protein [Tanacetum cinerariifolium]